MKARIALICLAVSSLASPSAGQAVTQGEAPAEMQQLAFLAGKWQGTASLRRGPGEPAQADVTELVAFKLQGSVLMLEGRGVAKIPDGSEMIVHDALGLISYDRNRDKFVMRTYRAGGEMLEPEIDVTRGKIVWRFDEPRAGKIRFTLSVDDDGIWQEVGEGSRDGQTWFKFFEMNLKRVP